MTLYHGLNFKILNNVNMFYFQILKDRFILSYSIMQPKNGVLKSSI